nr:ABC transporter permease [Spirosomataceae bacterium]
MKTSIIASLFGGRGANYLKITLAVLRRRKFFTFISLFGICFTLTILVVVTAFIDHLLAAGYPETERERSMYALMLEERDTKNQGASSGPMSFWFINKYIKSLKTPEKVALTSMIASSNTYINNQKIRVFFKYTDGAFWEIHQFKFVEGKAFTQKDIDNNEFVVVINEDLRDKYFGKGIACVGKSFEMDSQTFRVIGVVKGVPITRIYTSADVYLPYNTTKKDLKSTQHRGDYIAIVLAKNQTDMPLIQAEYNEVARRIKPQQSGTFKPDVLKTSIDGYLESFLRGIFRDNENATRYVYGFLVLFALLFMSLPAINLVNINMSRIMER